MLHQSIFTRAGTPAFIFHWWPESKWQRHLVYLQCLISGKQRTLWDCLLEKAKEYKTCWHQDFEWDANSTLEVQELGKHSEDRFLHWQVIHKHEFWGSWLSALTEPANACDSAKESFSFRCWKLEVHILPGCVSHLLLSEGLHRGQTALWSCSVPIVVSKLCLVEPVCTFACLPCSLWFSSSSLSLSPLYNSF